MTPHQRLMSLAREHGLADESLSGLSALLRALSRPEAPTTIHRASQAVDVHLADSLAALVIPDLRAAGRVADLGSGAGLPGLALAAALPDARLTLLESNARKSVFISETATAMALTNATVVQSRVEDWRAGLESQDVVCARALARLPILLEYAAPILRVGGLLVAWKAEVDDVELVNGEAAAALLACEPAGVVTVEPFPTADRRTLHLFRKIGPTPARYPRRAGIAVKRPLTAPNGPHGPRDQPI